VKKNQVKPTPERVVWYTFDVLAAARSLADARSVKKYSSKTYAVRSASVALEPSPVT